MCGLFHDDSLQLPGSWPSATLFWRVCMLRYFVLLCTTFCLVGCTSLSVKPDNGDTITATQSPQDVQISLTWPNGDLISGPTVAIDGVSFPNSALTVTATGATGTAHLLNGQHTILVQTIQKCWYCSGNVFNYSVSHNSLCLRACQQCS